MRYAVYYAKNPTFTVNQNLNLANLTQTHVKVRELVADDLNDVYRIQQGEVWSPNGEERRLIEKLGLHHTSMSVGDVIAELNETGGELRHWQVAVHGFEPFRVRRTMIVELSFLEAYNNENEPIQGLEVKVNGQTVEQKDMAQMMGGGIFFEIWSNDVCGLNMTYGDF